MACLWLFELDTASAFVQGSGDWYGEQIKVDIPPPQSEKLIATETSGDGSIDDGIVVAALRLLQQYANLKSR